MPHVLIIKFLIQWPSNTLGCSRVSRHMWMRVILCSPRRWVDNGGLLIQMQTIYACFYFNYWWTNLQKINGRKRTPGKKDCKRTTWSTVYKSIYVLTYQGATWVSFVICRYLRLIKYLQSSAVMFSQDVYIDYIENLCDTIFLKET